MKLLQLVSAFVVCSQIAFSEEMASNIKEAQKFYNEAVAKADADHAVAVAKADSESVTKKVQARQKAVESLVAIADDAYKQKERAIENAAYTEILRLDREHAKAVDYFKSLGILKETLTKTAGLESNSKPETTPKNIKSQPVKKEKEKRWFIGHWSTTWNNNARFEWELSENGANSERAGTGNVDPSQIIDADNTTVIITGNVKTGRERWPIVFTKAGDLILCRQWADIEAMRRNDTPTGFGFGIRNAK